MIYQSNHLHTFNPQHNHSCPIHQKINLGKTSSANEELRSSLRVASIGKVSHDVESILANGVTSGTELLALVVGEVGNGLGLEWVTEENSTRDLASRKALGGVVNNHGSLGISSDNDLGLGALAESLLHELGHGGTTAGTEFGVTLLRGLVDARLIGLGETYSSAGGVGHTLDGDLVAGESLQLSGDLGSNDGTHVTDLAGTTSENESQLGAVALGGDAVGSAAALD